MLISVIICTHSLDNKQNLMDAVDSILNQTLKELEIIVVVDGSEELYKGITEVYDAEERVKVVAIKANMGICSARNTGINAAQGDLVAFSDDDAVAEKRWIENLVDTYQKLDAIAVGGKILPIWLSKQPDYFPDELGWLVGITYEGFAEERVVEVRNTFGPNMSFKKNVFEKIGLFTEEFGFSKKGLSCLQGEEAEFALRMKQELGQGVIYNPRAVVYHKIPAWKTERRTLLRRAFYQGYSKALLKRFSPSPDTLTTEGDYLKDIFFKHIPRRIKRVFSTSNGVTELKKLSILIASVFSVGLGFLYGYFKRT
ncbi:MAG: glycosyltransferase family 2 protein [Desulfobacteraceae bacterium]|nr:glycosyltransferase family 2 protein [Desulfobacteraceae bacterium]